MRKPIIVGKDEMKGIREWLKKPDENTCPMKFSREVWEQVFCHPNMCEAIFPKLADSSETCPCECFGKRYVFKRVRMLLKKRVIRLPKMPVFKNF